MFDKIGQARLSELHFKSDDASQLQAIIAIHSTRLGPALGGCRCIEYDSDEAAINDVIRLARGMSYKAALAKVPQGGGKAVIIKPKHIHDRAALYRAFGKFVNELGGRYITAVDSGSSLDDMDQVAHETSFVSGSHIDGLDPSPMTALGVLAGMKAAAYHHYGNADLSGRIVAIQGVGNVGCALAELLHRECARLLVSDVDNNKVEQVRRAFAGTEHADDVLLHQLLSRALAALRGAVAVLDDQLERSAVIAPGLVGLFDCELCAVDAVFAPRNEVTVLAGHQPDLDRFASERRSVIGTGRPATCAAAGR